MKTNTEWTERLKKVDHVVVHANCPDGLASALLIHDALWTWAPATNTKVTFLQHGTPEAEAFELESGQLWCDICPSKEKAEHYLDHHRDDDNCAIVLDHHKTNEEVVRMFGKRGFFGGPKESGASLAYDYVWDPINLSGGGALEVHARGARQLATLACIRDTWQRDSPYWEDACAQAAGLLFYGWERLRHVAFFEGGELMRIGHILRSKELENVEKLAKRAIRVGNIAFVNERAISDVAEFMREKDPNLELIVGFFYQGESDGSRSLVYSMRSKKGGIDCSEIAKRNGGGGHQAAAGYTIKDVYVLGPVAAFIQRITVEESKLLLAY